MMSEFIKIVPSERYKNRCDYEDERNFKPFYIRYRDLTNYEAWRYLIESCEELSEFLSTFDYKKNRILGFCEVTDEEDTN